MKVSSAKKIYKYKHLKTIEEKLLHKAKKSVCAIAGVPMKGTKIKNVKFQVTRSKRK